MSEWQFLLLIIISDGFLSKESLRSTLKKQPLLWTDWGELQNCRPWEFGDERNINEQRRYLTQISKTKDLGREDEQSSVHYTLEGIQSIQGDGKICPEAWQWQWMQTVSRVTRRDFLLPLTHLASNLLPLLWGEDKEFHQSYHGGFPERENWEEGRANWLREAKLLKCKSM